MRAAIVIPARFASTRLPGKLLLADTGKPVIQHTYERACLVENTDQVIVATDDQRIFDVVKGFGGDVVMTAGDHETGSSRVAEAAAGIDADVIINLQGDEPEIDPVDIGQLIEIQSTAEVFASTLACPFPNSATSGAGSPDDTAAVKVILQGGGADERPRRARFFTRTICPWPRRSDGVIAAPENYFLHLGVYGYSKESLARFAAAPQGVLEKTARLEQLRILEMGEAIAVGVVRKAAPGIDTPEDYAAFKARMISTAS